MISKPIFAVYTKLLDDAESHNPASLPSSTPASALPVTLRAVLAGAVCSALTCALVTWAELVISTIRIGYLQLPPVSLVLLIVLVAAARGMSNVLKGRWSFTAAEQITVYVMSIMAAMVSSHGMAQKLIPLLVAPNYFATPMNGWQALFSAHLPHWLVPYNPKGPDAQPISVGYYEGLSGGGRLPGMAWVVPLLAWSVFLGLIFFSFLCLTAILRRQWVDNEKLSFPLAQLPLEVLSKDERGRNFFARPLVWLGALIPVAVYGIDWVHQIEPVVPLIPMSMVLNDYMTSPPWNQVSYTPLIFSFAALGFFYLLPADVLLSIWFFFLLDRAEELVGIQYGFSMPHMPTSWLPLFQGYQTIGAYVALVGYLLYVARPHLKNVWLNAIGRIRTAEAQDEILSYRTAFWGLTVSLVLCCLMLWAVGMSFWLSVLEIVTVVLLIAVVMARSTAEGGLLMTETTFQPYDIYRMGGSMHGLGAGNLTLLAFVDHLLSHDQRGLLMTGMLDSSYLGDRVGMQRRSLGKVIALGVLLAALIAIPLQLFITYKIHALRMDVWMMQGSPKTQFNVNQAFLQAPMDSSGTQWQRPAFFCVGVLVTLAIMQMRSSFHWWPLHPLGYALAGSQSTIEFWFPCLLAWALKSVTLRYGGRTFYQTMRQFFLGLIVGEFSMAVVSAMVNMLFHIPPPPFPWV